MISVIIPVYNTEKYLEKCLNSILEQDYCDYEIITVNDGSTDDSLKILESYAKQDNRIRVINKDNEGQGVARNIAIGLSRGEYIVFIDSDDWITSRTLSLLINKAEDTGADIVVGNLATTFLDSEKVKNYNNEKVFGVIEGDSLTDNVFNISPCPVPKLIRRALFTDNQICFPKIYFEDLAIMPLLYAMAKRIAFVKEYVYIQRMNSGSTVHRIENIYDRITFVEYLVEGFKEKGIYDEYKSRLDEYIIKRAQTNLRMVKGLTNKCYIDFANEQQRVWKENYGLNVLAKKEACCFGSYNIMILTKIFMRMEDSAIVENYFGGSALISCMSDNNTMLNRLNACHSNSFRRRLLINDFSRSLLHMNPGEFYGNEFFFVDFMEERYDIGVYEGEYFTISQAFEDLKEKLDIDYEVIKAFSQEWWKLWENACNLFADKLKMIVGDKRIVLIKSFLTERYYDDEAEIYFDEIDSIRTCNVQLDRCYEYFIQKCPEAKVIDISDYEVYKTDANFRHGCFPWHLSDFAYGKLAGVIEGMLNNY